MSLRNAGITNLGIFLRGCLNLTTTASTSVPPPDNGFRYEGTVINAFHRPIRGARVQLIGTNLTTITDADGRFRLGDAKQTDAENDDVLGGHSLFYPLEFSAEGQQPQTIIPVSLGMTKMSVVLDPLPYGLEGEQADLAPYAYEYRKGDGHNPSETRWFEPTEDMLCGLLWEEKPLIDRVEVEFSDADGALPDSQELTLNVLSGGLYPRRVHPTETVNWYARDKQKLRLPLTCLGIRRSERGTIIYLFGHDPLDRPGNFIFTNAVRPRRSHPVQALSLHYHGKNPGISVPIIRAYGQGLWSKPRTLNIEWGFMGDKPNLAVNGWIESQCCRVGKVEILEPGNGATLVGEHHWREHNSVSSRQGIRATVFPIAGPQSHRTAVNFYASDVLGGAYDEITTIQPSATVTLWTTIGSVTFAVSDLDRGPILIPSLGIFIALADSGITGRQFVDRLTAGTGKTVRQQVREHAEQTYDGAMSSIFGETVKDLPPFPEPPYTSPMQIDVPEKALVSQWRLGAWHLKRWSKQIADNMYAISIWPFRTSENTPTCIAAEMRAITVFDGLAITIFDGDGM